MDIDLEWMKGFWVAEQKHPRKANLYKYVYK